MKTINTLTLLSLLFVLSAHAQTAGDWNFNNTLSAAHGSNLTAGTAALGSAIPSNSFNASTEYYGQDGWPAGGIDMNAYLQFSVNPNAGYYMVLNTVTMILRRSNTGTPSGSGPNNWSLRSSLDGYTTDLATGSMTFNYATYTATLPAAFQSLTSGVTFRLYGYNMTINSGGNSRFVYDDISIQGQAIAGTLAEQSIDLTAKTTANMVSLQWQSQGFAAGTLFSLERSTDGANFSAIDQQTSTTAETSVYQYTDKTAPSSAKLYYRVLATEPGGAALRSAISVVAPPTAATTETTIRTIAASGSMVKTVVHLGEPGSYQLNVWSQEGKALYRQTLNGHAGDQATEIALGNYPHGVYILTVSTADIKTSRQFIY